MHLMKKFKTSIPSRRHSSTSSPAVRGVERRRNLEPSPLAHKISARPTKRKCHQRRGSGGGKGTLRTRKPQNDATFEMKESSRHERKFAEENCAAFHISVTEHSGHRHIAKIRQEK